MKIETTTTVKKTMVTAIHRSELVGLLRARKGYEAIPNDAQVWIELPSGGDLSGQRLDLDEFEGGSIRVGWTEVYEK